MSVFTNPASGSLEHAAAYTQAVVELLGSRDPIEVLGATADLLREAVEGLTARELAEPEAEGKWSIRQVLRHLADTEMVWCWRTRLVLAQDRPQITGFDQDAWADRLRYAEADESASLDEFEVLRAANLRLLARAAPEDLSRIGVHAERGEERLDHMLRMQAGHDLLHLRQIARVRGVVARGSVQQPE